MKRLWAVALALTASACSDAPTKPPSLASLTLRHDVVNNNGGAFADSAWMLSADGPTPLSGAGGAVSGADLPPAPTS